MHQLAQENQANGFLVGKCESAAPEVFSLRRRCHLRLFLADAFLHARLIGTPVIHSSIVSSLFQQQQQLDISAFCKYGFYVATLRCQDDPQFLGNACLAIVPWHGSLSEGDVFPLGDNVKVVVVSQVT